MPCRLSYFSFFLVFLFCVLLPFPGGVNVNPFPRWAGIDLRSTLLPDLMFFLLADGDRWCWKETCGLIFKSGNSLKCEMWNLVPSKSPASGNCPFWYSMWSSLMAWQRNRIISIILSQWWGTASLVIWSLLARRGGKQSCSQRWTTGREKHNVMWRIFMTGV